MTERVIVDRVRDAAGRRVVAVGGGASARPEPGDAAIETTGHSGIVELRASDLMVTAKSGTPLADLDAALRAAGRRLPLAPWSPPGATLGGAVAASADGLSAANGFRWKDLVLEARLVLLDGTVIRSGARVVKSVAGFDIHRAVCGMGSRLGVLLDVTVRIEGVPERSAAWTARAAGSADALRLAAAAESLPMQPRGLVVSAEGGALAVDALLEGPGAAVDAMGARLRAAGFGECDAGPRWTSLTARASRSGAARRVSRRLERSAFPSSLAEDEFADLPRRLLRTTHVAPPAPTAARDAILRSLGVAP